MREDQSEQETFEGLSAWEDDARALAFEVYCELTRIHFPPQPLFGTEDLDTVEQLSLFPEDVPEPGPIPGPPSSEAAR